MPRRRSPAATLQVKVRRTAQGLVLEHKHGPMPADQLRELWLEVLDRAQREALAAPDGWPAQAPVVLTETTDV